jgi:hypothetical protein
VTGRKLCLAERAARDALEPYVEAEVITRGEAEEIFRSPSGLPDLEAAVRANLASGNGSTWLYGVRVREARVEWKNTRQRGSGTALRALDHLMREEIACAVYLALRVGYKSPEQIEDEDRYAPLFVTARQALAEIAEDDKAKQAATDCVARAPHWLEIVPLDGRVVARVLCECGSRHWDTVDLGPGATLGDVDRLDYTILGPSKVLKHLGVRITGEFEQVHANEGQPWRLRAPARS